MVGTLSSKTRLEDLEAVLLGEELLALDLDLALDLEFDLAELFFLATQLLLLEAD